MRKFRWLLFSRSERLVIRQALNGKTPYIGGKVPYGADYAPSVDLLHALRAELKGKA